MKYSLVVYNNSDEFKEITGYSNIMGFDDINETSLKDIVTFTNHFTDKEDLMLFLKETNLIPEDYINGNFGIVYFKSKDAKGKILQYGISFIEDTEYFNVEYLKEIFIKYFHEEQFMEEFREKYYLNLKDVGIFQKIVRYLNYAVATYFYKGYLPNNTESEITNFINLYTHRRNKDGIYIEDFTRIRDLAMFIIDYERTYIRDKKTKSYYSKENLQTELDHFLILLEDEGLTEDARDAYRKRVSALESEIDFLNSATRRRKNNATTTN